jgi:DNA modification methylase
MSVFFTDPDVTLHHGDALQVCRELPDRSVDCCVTSPPYFSLRDYGSEGQYGLEDTPQQYVNTMRDLFHEIYRVLADDATLWLNLGDSYGPDKNLYGIPWRVAFALQDDRWVLRSAIIWDKPNGMPESVKDRFSNKYEHIFLFAKKPRYWFDLAPLREQLLHPGNESKQTWARQADPKETLVPGATTIQHRKDRTTGRGTTSWAASANGANPQRDRPGSHEDGKNPGDVWHINTQPFGGSHFAVMPQEIVRRAVLAGCKPGGTVLDPFSGSGTTGLVANRHGRKYVGIDISADYLRLSLTTRLQQQALDFGALP